MTFNEGSGLGNGGLGDRDSFWLHILKKPMVDGPNDVGTLGVKEFKESSRDSDSADNLFVNLPEKETGTAEFLSKGKLNVSSDEDFPSLVKSAKANGMHASVGEPTLKPLWSKVVADPPPLKKQVRFEYFPRQVGFTVVSPPVEVLKESNEKFKFCIVGTLAKSYKTVVKLARKLW